MSDETTLLSCPFCGGEASKRLFYKGKYRVHCNVCDAHSGDVCDTEAEAIAAWNTRAEHGTLTAEQIGEAIERNFMKICVLDDGKPVEWREDWVCRVGIDYRAIADELNELGSGTCEMIDDPPEASGEQHSELYPCDMVKCSACGAYLWNVNPMRYCPNCGKRIRKKADE